MIGCYCNASQPCIRIRHLRVRGGEVTVIEVAVKTNPVPGVIAAVLCAVGTIAEKSRLAAKMFKRGGITAAYRASVYKRVISGIRQSRR